MLLFKVAAVRLSFQLLCSPTQLHLSVTRRSKMLHLYICTCVCVCMYMCIMYHNLGIFFSLVLIALPQRLRLAMDCTSPPAAAQSSTLR